MQSLVIDSADGKQAMLLHARAWAAFPKPFPAIASNSLGSRARRVIGASRASPISWDSDSRGLLCGRGCTQHVDERSNENPMPQPTRE